MRFTGLVAGFLMMIAAVAAEAQETWVQIEAQPSLREGEERARAYSGVFPNVNGFAMTTGWYAVVLGPFTPEEAERQLFLLKSERLIPADSYIATGSRFQSQFWPVGGTAALPQPEAPAVDTLTATQPSTLPDETPNEARRSEALLLAEERRALQEALQWEGFYTGAIDGAFGAGTRRSMGAWQAAMGYEASGILTTAQRAELMAAYQADLAAIGLETVTEDEAGIEIALPLALISFDRYQPPFVHYGEKDGSGFRALLISQKGDRATLSGLYDIMQTLEIVPVSGDRQLNATSFVLTGQNDRLQSYSQAELAGGTIKGFTLVWPTAEADRAARVVDAMKASFRSIGDTALDEGLGTPLAEDHATLMSGLEIRRPALSRSGFYLDGTGLVATTDEVIAECRRLTLDGGIEADTVLHDAATGLAVLKPRTSLAPRAQANLSSGRVNSEIAVAGFSYQDALDTAVMSFGTLADTRGLGGEEQLTRLSVRTLDGDAGGPVLDATGAVVGMLLPRDKDGSRVLPEDVGLALDGTTIRAALAGAGLVAEPVAETASTAALAPEDLTMLGRDMTVLVSCWN
ncbi:serine protease [Defluviimonas aestuarii]|uniref:serine protease n=1 Tax=Albidovulum aestuarii TaxID=1130726 RepID=UPI00249A91E0|nr:serine protease [Defluviimonas aestuarii]MDI3336287.1 serine protease [Defluviimonas aestuarii]